MLDDVGVLHLKPIVTYIKQALSAKQYKNATDLFSELQEAIGNVSNFILTYNNARHDLKMLMHIDFQTFNFLCSIWEKQEIKKMAFP